MLGAASVKVAPAGCCNTLRWLFGSIFNSRWVQCMGFCNTLRRLFGSVFNSRRDHNSRK
jgi:hypothetical protein